MAEAILKSQNIPGFEVRSAGVFAQDGSEASANTVTVLKEKGIDAVHRSSMLNKELIDWTSYIFTMTTGHKHSVIQMFPEAAGKTYTLREFANHGAGNDIIDPFGGPVEIYRETFNEINEAIKQIISKLQNK